MEKLMQWLSDEAKGFVAVAGYVILAALIVSAIDQSVVAALTNWGVLEPSKVEEPMLKYLNGYILADMLLIGPALEEVAFRFLPLAIVVALISKSPRFVFGANLFFAALFGSVHPYTLHGRALAAVAGFVLGLVFLKCGGMNRAFLKASAAAIAAHSASNLFVVLYEGWQYIAYKS